MAVNIALNLKRFRFIEYLFDAVALSLIYFIPALSHMLNVPLYLFEPMRIILILSIAHTNRTNAILLALTLPFVSFVFSGHPVLVKSLLMTGELVLNVWLFFAFSRIVSNSFIRMMSSIILSKLIYYAVKMILINTALLSSDLVSSPIIYQVIITLLLSGYIFLFTDILKPSKKKEFV